MALDGNFKIEKDDLVTLIDGTTPTAVELDMTCVTSHSMPLPEADDFVFKCRDAVQGSREGVLGEFDFTLTEHFKEYTNATAGVARDFMKGINGYSGNTTTNSAHEKNAFDLKVTTDKTTGQTTDPSVTYNDCVLLSATVNPSREGIAIDYNIRCYGGYTVAGEA